MYERGPRRPTKQRPVNWKVYVRHRSGGERDLAEDVYLAGVIILMMGILTVVGTLISDIMLVVADPRIKLTGTARGGGGTV